MVRVQPTVPADVAHLLEKDAELFHFFKQNGQINKNQFLNTLFLNYHNTYFSMRKEIGQNLIEIAKKSSATIDDSLLHDLVLYIENKHMTLESDSKGKVLTIQINKANDLAYKDFIDTFSNQYASESELFKRLFVSYASLPLNQRERIIFKTATDKILEAINLHKKIKITRDNRDRIVSPYSLTTSKEELYNYLLCKDHTHEGRLMSLRLTFIEHVFILDEDIELDKTDIHYLEKTRLQCPQFVMRPNDEQVKVYLTKKGIANLKKIYTFRPPILEIDEEKQVYTFSCSQSQAERYFTKFGSEAIVIEPKALSESIKNELFKAYKDYNEYIKHGLESLKRNKKAHNQSY